VPGLNFAGRVSEGNLPLRVSGSGLSRCAHPLALAWKTLGRFEGPRLIANRARTRSFDLILSPVSEILETVVRATVLSHNPAKRTT
jgi:hypothetical protein